jgi:hypothetical protein
MFIGRVRLVGCPVRLQVENIIFFFQSYYDARRLNSLVLVVVFHHTDTHIYLLSLALALSNQKKQKNKCLSAGVYIP